MYLLGDFEVYLKGTGKTLKKRSETIGFGSIVPQGLPFYSGNIIYEREIDVPDCDLKITVSKYRGALVKIFLDGKDAGNIILPPYSLKIEKLSAGVHRLEFLLYGNRHNTFASLHACTKDPYCGPELWYKTGDDFSYEYNLAEMGILKEPVIEINIIND